VLLATDTYKLQPWQDEDAGLLNKESTYTDVQIAERIIYNSDFILSLSQFILREEAGF